MIVRGLYDTYCPFVDIEHPERPGQRAFAADAHALMIREVKYVQRGLLPDLPSMTMCRAVGKLSTGYEVHRGRRNNSALEAQHLHYRCS